MVRNRKREGGGGVREVSDLTPLLSVNFKRKKKTWDIVNASNSFLPKCKVG